MTPEPPRATAVDPWNIPVLLTSSVVAHDARVSLTDTSQRIELALESVARWLALYPRIHLVLCDGSSFDFSSVIAERFPDASVECLFFSNDQQAVQRQGRGFGEGEIVRYAVAHSQSLRKAGAFAKCTSKLWVRNYGDCLADWNDQFLCKVVFDHVFSPFRQTTLAYIDTRFYIVAVPFYLRFLIDAHVGIDVDAGKGLEECFLQAVEEHHLSGIVLNTPPVIDGVGGGTGKYYRNPLKRRIKEHLRLWLARRQPGFRTLFAPRR